MHRYHVFMFSIPAMGRTFYDGKVEVDAGNEAEAEQMAINRAAAVHGHREFRIQRIVRMERRR